MKLQRIKFSCSCFHVPKNVLYNLFSHLLSNLTTTGHRCSFLIAVCPQEKEKIPIGIDQNQLSLLFNYMHKRVLKVLRVFHSGG